MKAIDLLKKYDACSEAILWVGDMTVSQAWLTCPRGDWMLWMYAKLYSDNLKELTLAKGHCANTVRHLMKDQRSLDAVDAAIAFGEGRTNREELHKAAYGAYSAAASAYSASAYSASAYSASAYAASADAYAASAAAAASADAAAAADAAAYSADAAAAADAARQKNRQKTADICRKYLTLCTH